MTPWEASEQRRRPARPPPSRPLLGVLCRLLVRGLDSGDGPLENSCGDPGCIRDLQCRKMLLDVLDLSHYFFLTELLLLP
jgi:hypothetical protein